MGIVNVTPDSFSDGGRFIATDAAVEHAQALIAGGADIIDIGGESSRPGSDPVPTDEELRRVLPVIERLATTTDVPISVDTTKAEVAAAALERGVAMINDISALRFDPELAAVVARHRAPIVIMHMLGRPKTMQLRPEYEHLMAEIIWFLRERIDAAQAAGIDPTRIIVDPGIGFGKTLEHNLEIHRRLDELAVLGRPILFGPSRKRFIGALTGIDDADQRVEGTIASIVAAICNGADMIRVHDVRECRRAALVADAIFRSG